MEPKVNTSVGMETATETANRARALLGDAYQPSTPQPTPERINQIATRPATIDATDIGIDGLTTPIPTPELDIGTEMAGITSAINQAETSLTEPETPAQLTETPSLSDQALQAMLAEVTGGFEVSEETRDLQTDAAIKKKRLNDLTTQITQFDKETKDELYRMSKNPEGKSMGANRASMQNYQYERYARPGGAADMAIEAQFALNDAQFAYEIANNAIQAEERAYDRKIQGLQAIYNMAQNDMSESEQMTYQSDLRLYESRVQQLSLAKQQAMQMASSQGAPQEVVLAIKNATTPEEVWASAGRYGADMLDREYKLAQIRSANVSADRAAKELELLNNPPDTGVNSATLERIDKLSDGKREDLTSAISTVAQVDRMIEIINSVGNVKLLTKTTPEGREFIRLKKDVADKLARQRTGAVVAKSEEKAFKEILGIGAFDLMAKNDEVLVNGLEQFKSLHSNNIELIDPLGDLRVFIKSRSLDADTRNEVDVVWGMEETDGTFNPANWY